MLFLKVVELIVYMVELHRDDTANDPKICTPCFAAISKYLEGNSSRNKRSITPMADILFSATVSACTVCSCCADTTCMPQTVVVMCVCMCVVDEEGRQLYLALYSETSTCIQRPPLFKDNSIGHVPIVVLPLLRDHL